MTDLLSVFQFVANIIGLFLSTMLANWFSTIIIFLMVLAGVVSVILVVRGNK